jgi:hypothetical protein
VCLASLAGVRTAGGPDDPEPRAEVAGVDDAGFWVDGDPPYEGDWRLGTGRRRRHELAELGGLGRVADVEGDDPVGVSGGVGPVPENLGVVDGPAAFRREQWHCCIRGDRVEAATLLE